MFGTKIYASPENFTLLLELMEVTFRMTAHMVDKGHSYIFIENVLLNLNLGKVGSQFTQM